MKKLTETQSGVLKALKQHGSWSWRKGAMWGCGWKWGTVEGTRRILDALVKKGYVVLDDQGVYHPVAEGEGA